MISLYDGQISDLLLNDARYDPKVMALSYAVLQEKRRLMREADSTRTLAVIDELPEKILDLLSVELRLPAYDEQFPIVTKRALIKGALSFHAKLGTPDAVNWLIGAIFGNGKIEEWFDYGGEPHYFRVSVRKSGSLTDIDSLYQFFRLIGRVKRLSSHLESVIVDSDPAQTALRVGASGAVVSRLSPVEQPDDLSVTRTVRTGGQASVTVRRPSVEQADSLSVTRTLRAGGAFSPTAFRAVPATPDSLTVRNALRFGGRLAFTHSLAIPAKAIDYCYPHTLKDAQSVGGTLGSVSSRAVPPVPESAALANIQRIGGKISGATVTFPLAENADAPLFHTLRTGGLTELSTRLPVPVAPEITDFPRMETRVGAGIAAERIAGIGVPAVDNAPELSAVLRVGASPETLTEIAVPQRNGNAAAYAIRTGGQSEREIYVPVPEIR